MFNTTLWKHLQLSFYFKPRQIRTSTIVSINKSTNGFNHLGPYARRGTPPTIRWLKTSMIGSVTTTTAAAMLRGNKSKMTGSKILMSVISPLRRALNLVSYLIVASKKAVVVRTSATSQEKRNKRSKRKESKRSKKYVLMNKSSVFWMARTIAWSAISTLIHVLWHAVSTCQQNPSVMRTASVAFLFHVLCLESQMSTALV